MAFKNFKEAQGMIPPGRRIIIRKKEILPFFPNDGTKLLIHFLKGPEPVAFPVENGDRAEFTSVGASPGRFDRLEKVMMTFAEEIPPRKGKSLQIAPGFISIKGSEPPLFEIPQQLREDPFGLTDDHRIRMFPGLLRKKAGMNPS